MTPRTARRFDVWIWVCVFGGLLTLVLGLSAGRLEPMWGWLLMVIGAMATVLGFVLWIVRSRHPDDRLKDTSRS
jgi:hypothetical protein